jgi:hypothetical protein
MMSEKVTAAFVSEIPRISLHEKKQRLMNEDI